MRTLGKWMTLFVVPLVLVVCVFAPLHAAHATALSLAHVPWPHLGPEVLLFPVLVGSTTGTTTGTDYSGLNDMLKNTYSGPFENNIEKESEVGDFIDTAEEGGFEVIDGPDGKSINLGHIFSSGGGDGFMNEDDYLYTPTNPTTKQSTVTIKQITGTVELSGRTMRRVKSGPAAFITWANEALPRKAERIAFGKDRAYLGTGTGIVCRYNGTPDGTGDPLKDCFGVAGLEGAEYQIMRDDNLRAGPNANGTSLRTGTAKIASIDYVNKAISTTVAGVANAPTAAADGDYLFKGDTNVNGSGTREFGGGFEAALDDGTNVATFQTLARATYPELNAQILDSSTGGYTQTLTEEIMDAADAMAWERGQLGKPSRILVNRSGQRSFWKTLKADREINDPRGAYQGGVNKMELKMQLGDRLVRVRAARKVPLSRCYGIDPTSVLRFRIGQGRWDDTDGSVWNRVVDSTGRKDAFFAVYVEEEEVGWGAPGKNFKITNLLAA